MAAATPDLRPTEDAVDKGLKSGALGLMSSIVIGVASTAPAYSLAATLGFVVVAIGLQSPAVAALAFVPMLLASIGYSEMNKADPDCGTTFTWATRAFGPRTGWAGGWAIVAADVLVMASLAQVAGAYVFDLFNTSSIGSNAASGWVLLVGIIWIILMTAICYVGIEVSANFQKALLSIEIVMLLVLSIVALVKVGTGHAPVGSLHVSAAWFNPFKAHSVGIHLRAGAVPVHLLGLGHRGVGQRGDRRPEPDPGPGRDHLDRRAPGHLPAGDHLGPGLRGDRHEGHRPGQYRQLRATCCRCSAARSSAPAASARS